MRRSESRRSTDRLWLVVLTFLLSLAFVAPAFAADEGSNDLPEKVLAEDDEGGNARDVQPLNGREIDGS